MNKRFLGPTGAAELRLLFTEQRLLQGTALAADLAEAASVANYRPDQPIYFSGKRVTRVIWFVLGGSVRLDKGGKPVATLARGQFFGEFPLLDPTALYAVSATAAEAACIATVPWDTFSQLADAHPALWRNMAAELAQRLRATPPPPPGDTEPKGPIEQMFAALWPESRALRRVLAVSVFAGLGLFFGWKELPDRSRNAWFGHAEAASVPASSPR